MAEFVAENILLFAELVSTVLLLIAAAEGSKRNSLAFTRVEWALRWIAAQPRLPLVAAFLLPIAVRTCLLPIWPLRSPAVHDEFSHLLLADTFAHGRLTNPTPPHWVHFETFHEIQTPTYCSIRPPGPALPLALAEVLTGQPWLGVLFGVGVMCATIAWMLQQYVSRTWALVGGVLSGIQYGIVSSWMNSYWGGTVAAVAGAIIFAETERLRFRRTVTDMVLFGSGIGLLINTRPFEGSVFCTAALGLLLFRMCRDRLSISSFVRQLLPLVIVLSLVLSWMLYYNYRTTGNPWHAAYVEGLQSYTMAPDFIWQSPRSGLHYNHPVMERLYADWEMDNYRQWLSLHGAVLQTAKKFFTFWAFFLRPALTVPVLLFLWRARHKWRSGNVFLVAAAGCAMIVELWFNPHYIAHLTGLVMLVIVLGLRELRHSGRAGFELCRLLPCAATFTIVLAIIPTVLSHPLPGQYPISWYLTEKGFTARAHIVDILQKKPGKQLVFVRYTPNHFFHREWIWNDADLAGSKVVWARDLGAVRDAQVVSSFAGRTVWLLEPDTPQPRLQPVYRRNVGAHSNRSSTRASH